MASLFVAPLLFVTGVSLTGHRLRDDSTLTPADSLPAHSVQVLVDPRVELVCIICLLAGYPEYGPRTSSVYVDDIHEHFDSHADHQVVRTARKLRTSRNFCCDKPPFLAVHMPDPFNPASGGAMDLLPAAYEKRFSGRRFVGEARDFSLTADFESFFRHHQGMYDGMVGALKETLERHAHLEWLPTFFGMDLGADAIVVPTVLTGGNHYGHRGEAADGRACLFCILGFQVDKNDKPICPEDAVALVVHELCHSYVNQMIDRHSAIMKAPCERVAPFVGEAFKRSYGTKWNIMIYESLVRACTVRYVATFDGSDAAAILIEADRRLGLPWTAELSDLLCKYEDQRDVFLTLDAFIPQIASFFREYDPGRLRSSIEPVTR